MDMSEPNSQYLYTRVLQYVNSASVDAGERFVRLYDSFGGCTLDSMNRFWRIQLATLPFDTIGPRGFLRITCVHVWLEDFYNYIVPYIQMYGLPKEI